MSAHAIPRSSCPRALVRALLCVAVALPACSAPDGTRDAAPDASVKPGINDRFLAPDVNVPEFVATFEGESREIARERAALMDTLELRPGDAVADIGAGTGLFLQPLAEAVGPRGKVYSVDIAPAFVEHLARRAREEGLAQVEVIRCTATSAELPDASVDVAFVCDTYHHFEHPRETLASLHRALRPGGRLVVVDFERLPGTSRDWVLEHVRAGKDEVRAELQAAGFRVLDEPKLPGLSENYVLRLQRP